MISRAGTTVVRFQLFSNDKGEVVALLYVCEFTSAPGIGKQSSFVQMACNTKMQESGHFRVVMCCDATHHDQGRPKLGVEVDGYVCNYMAN